MIERKRISEEEYRRLSEKYQELEKNKKKLKKGFKSFERFQKFYGLLLKRVDRIVKKQLEELIKENQILKGQVVQKEKECKELKSKNEEVKKEKLMLKEEIEQKIRTENYRFNLMERFLHLQERLWELEKNNAYEEFFNDSVWSLQILIGLDKEIEKQTEERIEYYIWDVIIEPLIRVMKKRKGSILDGKLVLPEQEIWMNKEKITKKIEQEPLEKIEQYLKEDERRVELKGIVLQKRQVVEDLGRMLEELEEIEKDHIVGKKEIHRLAREVRLLLEKNGIYPLFAEELKKEENLEVKGRMIPVNSNSIKYPGLFIRRNGVLEVFGMNVGMDDEIGE